jgi:hypothetical protein
MPDWSGGIRGPAHGGMHGQPLPGLLGALGELAHAQLSGSGSRRYAHSQPLPGSLGGSSR